MYEQFFEMAHTPFSRDVPPQALYESASMRDALGRLGYVADRQLFAVVTVRKPVSQEPESFSSREGKRAAQDESAKT